MFYDCLVVWLLIYVIILLEVFYMKCNFFGRVMLRTVCKLSDSDADELAEWLFSEFKDYAGGKEIE